MAAGPVPGRPFEGLLLSDPEYGTTIKAGLSRGQPSDGSIMPVMWPTGYTGVWLIRGEVEVLDEAGNVVATTGRRYWLEAGPVSDSAPESRRLMETVGAFPACGHVIPK